MYEKVLSPLSNFGSLTEIARDFIAEYAPRAINLSYNMREFTASKYDLLRLLAHEVSCDSSCLC